VAVKPEDKMKAIDALAAAAASAAGRNSNYQRPHSELLARASVSLARAGVDIIAPST